MFCIISLWQLFKETKHLRLGTVRVRPKRLTMEMNVTHAAELLINPPWATSLRKGGPWKGLLKTSLRKNRDLFSVTFWFVCRFAKFEQGGELVLITYANANSGSGQIVVVFVVVVTKPFRHKDGNCNIFCPFNFSYWRGNSLYPRAKQFWRSGNWISTLVNTFKYLSRKNCW